MTARTQDRVEAYAMSVTCRCGCGSPIASTRTFVNKEHQVAWLRAQAAKRRRARAADAHTRRVEPAQPTLDLHAGALEPVSVALVDPPWEAVAAAAPVIARDTVAAREPVVARETPAAPEAAAAAATAAAPETVPADTARFQATETVPENLPLLAEIYLVGGVVTALPVFFGVWLFCLASFGLPLGGGLGWLPALAAAGLAGAVWPLVLIAGIILALMLVV